MTKFKANKDNSKPERADKPAYPFEGGNNNGMQPTYGMSKREKFAMAAMQGLISGFSSDGKDDWPNSEYSEHYDVVAGHSVEFADALLKQLGEKND